MWKRKRGVFSIIRVDREIGRLWVMIVISRGAQKNTNFLADKYYNYQWLRFTWKFAASKGLVRKRNEIFPTILDHFTVREIRWRVRWGWRIPFINPEMCDHNREIKWKYLFAIEQLCPSQEKIINAFWNFYWFYGFTVKSSSTI